MLHLEFICISSLLLPNFSFLSFCHLTERMKLMISRRYNFVGYLYFHLLYSNKHVLILFTIFQEISVLSQCRCPYITEYYGSYLNQTKLWIIMEYMAGGSVADLVGYFCFLASICSVHEN